MTRRLIGFLVTLALGCLVAPHAADTQPARKVTRVGALSAAAPRSAPHWVAFEQRLHELGFLEGHNLEIAFRNAEGIAEKFDACASELVRFQSDVIVAGGQEASLRAVTRATSTIPIVMVAVGYDPMALGYIAGLAHPGGNITGVFFRQLELTGKRLELLKEATSTGTRVAVLSDPFTGDQLEAAAAAARLLGMHLQPLALQHPPYDYESALRGVRQGHADALLVLMSPVFFRDRTRIVELATQHRLPVMYGAREYGDVGGLLSYGANLSAMWRRAADYVDKILKGTNPADLPVEQPVRFELVINLKTAQALGLTLPPTLLFQADEVIR